MGRREIVAQWTLEAFACGHQTPEAVTVSKWITRKHDKHGRELSCGELEIHENCSIVG
jgi:hypothetical protein